MQHTGLNEVILIGLWGAAMVLSQRKHDSVAPLVRDAEASFMPTSQSKSPLAALPPIDPQSRAVNVVIDTPKGSRNKFKLNEVSGIFSLGSVLPAGSSFPYDFGFIPGTKAEDGDPLDVLVIMDAPAFSGCRVEARLLGVLEAEQTENRKTIRNDRLIAVAQESPDHRNLKKLKDLEPHRLAEIEHFFISYNEMRDRRFKVLARRGPAQATRLLRQAIRNAEEDDARP